MMRLPLCFLLLICSLLLGCAGFRQSGITVHLAPYHANYGTLMSSKDGLERRVKNGQMEFEELRPEIFSVVLVNYSSESVEIPSFNQDPIGNVSLYFEIRDGDKHISVVRSLNQDRDAYIEAHETPDLVTSRCFNTVAPNDAVVFVLHFGLNDWENADEIFKRKNSCKAKIRAVYELRGRNTGTRDPISLYSEWVNISKLFPFPLNKVPSLDKLVF